MEKIEDAETTISYTVSSSGCDYGNSLINNNSYYLFSTFSSLYYSIYNWVAGTESYVNKAGTNYLFCVRPVIELSSTVYVTGGTGTYSGLYQISNG